MKLLRFGLRPSTTWVSAWQADTLSGMLACLYGRAYGAERLKADLLEPWLGNSPPFVLSDACPGDLLPAPACAAMLAPPDADRKKLKRFEWLTPEQFRQVQLGTMPAMAGEPPNPIQRTLRMRNSIDRTVESVGDQGQLYSVPLKSLREDSCLSVYARIEKGREGWVRKLLQLLTESGFGADAAVGQGQLDAEIEVTEAAWLADIPDANGWVSLSTFQPSASDPVTGYWRSFVKYGRLGPDPGADGVFKRPQWMLRAGAVFRSDGPVRDWYGRSIPDRDLLPGETMRQLSGEDIHPVQPAFALALPVRWSPGYDL